MARPANGGDASVYSAFDERWDVASRHFRGEHIPETAAQHEDYEAWAREFNENPRDGYKRISENAGHICGQLGLGWDLVLAVAAGHTDPEQARKESLSAALSEAGPLVGHLLLSQMLGLSRHARHAKQVTFPKPVFRFAKGNPMWLRSDIEGYTAGRRDFTHAEGVLQDQYLDGHQLGAAVLGLASIEAVREDGCGPRLGRLSRDRPGRPATTTTGRELTLSGGSARSRECLDRVADGPSAPLRHHLQPCADLHSAPI